MHRSCSMNLAICTASRRPAVRPPSVNARPPRTRRYGALGIPMMLGGAAKNYLLMTLGLGPKYTM